MLPPCSVIIVDGNPFMGRFYSLYFASVNIEPIVFTNPLIALDHFKQYHHRYTVALINSSLSNINGLELARKMRQYNSDINLLLLKTHYIKDPSQNTKFGEAGVSEVLSKPISIDKIGSRVISLCSENAQHKVSILRNKMI